MADVIYPLLGWVEMRVEKGTGSVNCATGHHHQLSTPSQLRNEDILRFVIYITQVQSDEYVNPVKMM